MGTTIKQQSAEPSARQLQVLDLCNAGLTYAEIGERLGISRFTVVYHLRCMHWGRNHKDDGDEESRSMAERRIKRDLARGLRCTHEGRKGPCSLLLPCHVDGHEVSSAKGKVAA